MGQFNIFVIRAILGVAIAVILARVFHPEFNIATVILLAILLVGLAYLLEYFRKRKSNR
ncbi:MAG: hypothetical protein ACOC0H_03485 [Thermodesulfobacteriota bacterium]